MSEDTAFPFKTGQPCLVKIDESKTQLTVKPISEKDATELGWEDSINNVLPLKNSRITTFRIFTTDELSELDSLIGEASR